MKFFNIDLHIAVIGDIKYILEKMGHSVTNKSLSGHTWVLGKSRDKTKIISRWNWRNIDKKMVDNFYESYKHELKEYDGFIATYPPALSMLYEKFDKPIIAVSATRYEHPFSRNHEEKWVNFNQFLTEKIDEKKLILLSNNKYDAVYMEYFLNKQFKIIPSLCEYTDMQYTGKKEGFLLFSKFKSLPKLENVYDKDKIFKYRLFQKGYKWQELGEYRGIIHIPYNASTMSIFEQYTANIPLFFPSKNFLRQLREQYSNEGVLSELSFNQIFNLPPHSTILNKVNKNDPNNYQSIDTVMKWVELADFYDEINMPFITYFDSFEHLQFLLKTVDLQFISNQMKKYNITRREKIFSEWGNIISNLENHLI